jgi:hypothetical protein
MCVVLGHNLGAAWDQSLYVTCVLLLLYWCLDAPIYKIVWNLRQSTDGVAPENYMGLHHELSPLVTVVMIPHHNVLGSGFLQGS